MRRTQFASVYRGVLCALLASSRGAEVWVALGLMMALILIGYLLDCIDAMGEL